MFPYRAERLSRLIANNRLLEQARLLDDEDRLITQIAQPTLIDKKTIGEVIKIAKKLASAGCPLRLVDNDDILDIAQLFSQPTAEAASDTLEKLLTELNEEDSPLWKDPVWTARVAAVLAYFSVPQSV